MAGTVWNSLTANTLGDANKVNQNFDWMEGSLLPHVGQFYPSGSVNNMFNLGSTTYRWRSCYVSGHIKIWNSIISGVDNDTMEIAGGGFRARAGGTKGWTANSGGAQRQIVTGTISTPDIRPAAATQQVSSGVGSAAAGTTITTLSVDVMSGTSLLLIAQVGFDFLQAGAGTGTVAFCIDRAGTGLTGGLLNYNYAHFAGANTRDSIVFHVFDAPAAGTYGYNLRYNASGVTFSLTTYNLQAIQMRK